MGRIEFGCVNIPPLFPEMFGDTAEVFKSEFLTKAENAVNQDDVHHIGIIESGLSAVALTLTVSFPLLGRGLRQPAGEPVHFS